MNSPRVKSSQHDRLCLLMVQKEALAEGGDGGASLTQWPLDRLRLLLAVRAPLIFILHMRIPWIAPCAFAVRVMMSTTPVGWPTWRSHAPDCVV